MADGMYNAFAPMQQAQKNLQNTFSEIAQSKRMQEKNKGLNQLRKIKMANALSERQDKRKKQVQQEKERTYVQNRMTEPATPGVPGGPSPEQGIPEQTESGVSPIKAELEFWKGRDPAKYREIRSKQVGKMLDLHKTDPEAASKYAEEHLGMKIRGKGGKGDKGGSIEVTTPENITLSGPPDNLKQFRDWVDQQPGQPSRSALNDKAIEHGVNIEYPEQEAQGKDWKQVSRKVNNYTQAIKNIMDKYEIGQGAKDALSNVDISDMSPSEAEQVIQNAAGGARNAYEQLEQKAKDDPRARNDLKNMRALKNKLIGLVGGEAYEGEPSPQKQREDKQRNLIFNSETGQIE